MLFNRPLISCVMLTADRPHLIQTAVRSFHSQTWQNKELIVYDTGRVPAVVERGPGVHIFRGPAATIGELRNRANDRSRGRLIAHWDDDDWSAAERLEEQFEILATHDADIVGYRTVYFRQDRGRTRGPKYWLYDGEPDYAMGTTMFYRRTAWENRPFSKVMVSEELDFSCRRKIITSTGHNPIRMIARHHARSTVRKRRFIADPGSSWKTVSPIIAKTCESLINQSH
jgi:O-antigen biosynthesis protein